MFKSFKIFLTVILIFLTSVMFAEKLATITDVLKPEALYVQGNRFYITEGHKIFVFSLKDFKLIKKFGKFGEGPGEFRAGILLTFHNDEIVINSWGKISFFSMDGEFKGEMKTPPRTRDFRKFGNFFVGCATALENREVYNTLNFFDSKLNIGQELFRQKRRVQAGRKFSPTGDFRFFYRIYKNEIYHNTYSGQIVRINNKGEKVLTIEPEYEDVPVTNEDIKRIHHYFKTEPNFKDQYERMKARFKFDSYFPKMRFFRVVDGKVYIITYRIQNKDSECFVYNVDGKFLKKFYIPIRFATIFEMYPNNMYDNKFYNIIENEDEDWELHVIPL